MKCTLRKVSQGVVATIDKRPKQLDWYLMISELGSSPTQCIFGYNRNWLDWHKIIASTFEVEKELKVDINGIVFNLPPLSEDEFIEYDYTETETQIIIQL